MARLTLDELLTPITPDQAKAKLYGIAATIGLNTTAWQRLSPLRTTYAIVAQFFSFLSQGQATVNAGGFLDTAEGDLLDRRANDVYKVQRNPATFASDLVTIVNHAGGVYSFSPGDLIVKNSTTGVTYANTQEVLIASNSTTSVQVQATIAGSAGSARSPGAIDAFVSAAPNLSVTNPNPIIGLDADTDPELRERCRDSLGFRSPMGPASAYRYVARTRSLNGGVGVSRVRVLPAIGDGTVRVVIATVNGGVNGTTTDPTTDLGKVFKALSDLVLPAGYTLLLYSATPRTISVDATIYIAASANLASADAVTAALTAITAFVPTIPIGGVVLRNPPGKVLYRQLESVYVASSPGIIEAPLTIDPDDPSKPRTADISMGAIEVAVIGSANIIPRQVPGA